jgi:hypothetical protein
MKAEADAGNRPSPPLIMIPFNISPALDQIHADHRRRAAERPRVHSDTINRTNSTVFV